MIASPIPGTLVVDCSVAAKWVLPEPGRDLAIPLLEQRQTRELTLIAPDLLLAEFASLLAKRSRRKQISAAQAKQAFALMTDVAPRLYDSNRRLAFALDLSLIYQMSFWDCVYLALAVEHRCPLLTADHRLFRSGVARHPAIVLLR